MSDPMLLSKLDEIDKKLQALKDLGVIHEAEIRRLDKENVAAWASVMMLLQNAQNRSELLAKLRKVAATQPGPVEDRVMMVVMAVEGSSDLVSEQLKKFGSK